MQAEMTIRTFDEICEESRTYVDVSDVAAWKIGDNAVEVLERYSDKTLTDYAMEIRKPKGTIAEYRSMSAYFDETARAEIFKTCPNISRSHMRKVLSIKDHALGRWAVEKCSARGWTVDQFGYILKRYKSLKGIGNPPRSTVTRVEFEATWDIANGLDTVIEVGDAIDNLMRIHPDATITVTVEYAARPAADGTKGA